MISREEIIKLAELSRLSLSEEEIGLMQRDITSILAYVDKLQSAPIKDIGHIAPADKNAMREDTRAHKKGMYTDELLKAAPNHTKEHIKVKKFQALYNKVLKK